MGIWKYCHNKKTVFPTQWVFKPDGYIEIFWKKKTLFFLVERVFGYMGLWKYSHNKTKVFPTQWVFKPDGYIEIFLKKNA